MIVLPSQDLRCKSVHTHTIEINRINVHHAHTKGRVAKLRIPKRMNVQKPIELKRKGVISVTTPFPIDHPTTLKAPP